ncbi:Hypothetical_protein [Hexamita inflata]|uniref:Hypothetical_protein n=1 Tax=Hexamita inflata TaxID=28002 RepID=A0AA86NZ31_9EUKA|nr:Hypothetical protein HINF_LOCUS16956 [Hexamita inflata]CAI9929317.1 Hypothetical protein HINF_LOCUS16962 [Hexamita inflata]
MNQQQQQGQIPNKTPILGYMWKVTAKHEIRCNRNAGIRTVQANICNAFKGKILKYGGAYGDNRVIPLDLRYNGTVYQKSMNMLTTFLPDHGLLPKQTLLPCSGALTKKPSCITPA